MAVGKSMKKMGRDVKSATKKAARKVDKAVVEPVADLFRSKSSPKRSHRKKSTKSSSSRTSRSKK